MPSPDTPPVPDLFASSANLAAAPFHPNVAPTSDAARLRRLVERCDGDIVRFCRTVLGVPATGDGSLWSRQIEVCESVRRYPLTLVPAGNSVGKSWVAAKILVALFLMYRNSITFSTAPTQGQLDAILWKEVRSTIAKSRIPLGVYPKGKAPILMEITPTWKAIGIVTAKIEAATGHHAEHLPFIGDEASGISESTYSGAWSLNPSRKILFGNPLHKHGRFYDLCRIAEEELAAERATGAPRSSNIVRISSLESPHIHMERSPYGMAAQDFLRESRRDYGEGSSWWQSHILALFPDSATEMAIPTGFLDAACRAIYTPRGFPRMAIDVAGGEGGDEWVILVRDDNGILALEWSRDWTEEMAARKAAELARLHKVAPHRVSYDKGGPGFFFGNRLAAAGLPGARHYFGGGSGFVEKKRFANLRSACAQALRERLDPLRMVQTPQGIWVPQPPFSFRPERPDWHVKLREVGLFRRKLWGDTYQLELGEEIRERLKRSPDTGDTLFQSMAFRD